jgi:AbrB family looped-hinge helix DNA binding protein
MTSKGQITVPAAVRRRAGLDKGVIVRFSVREDGVVELRPLSEDSRSLAGLLKGAGPALTLEEMDDAIARAVIESCSP